MSWYNVISHNSTYFLVILYVKEIAKFLGQLYYNESDLLPDHFKSFIDGFCYNLMLLQKCLIFKIKKKDFLINTDFW